VGSAAVATIVITGSAGGIGGGIARAFYQQGFNVVLSDMNQQALAERIAIIAGDNSEGRIHAVPCDVTDKSQVQSLWQQAQQQYGRIDYWVNNAGLGGTQKTIKDSDIDQLLQIVDVNIKGVIIGTHVAVNAMAAQGGGKIYNMAGFGVDGFTRKTMVAYGTTKRAVGYFSNGVAKEIAGSETTIGWINPGMVITPLVIAGAKKMPREEWDKAGRKMFNLFGETAEHTGQQLMERMIQDNNNGTFIKLLPLPKMLGKLFISLFRKRDLLSKYGI
jgi:NAD(P)-dependent dehydrogenase (short-subunit alcohol dehydrogenase family)